MHIFIYLYVYYIHICVCIQNLLHELFSIFTGQGPPRRPRARETRGTSPLPPRAPCDDVTGLASGAVTSGWRGSREGRGLRWRDLGMERGSGGGGEGRGNTVKRERRKGLMRRRRVGGERCLGRASGGGRGVRCLPSREGARPRRVMQKVRRPARPSAERPVDKPRAAAERDLRHRILA